MKLICYAKFGLKGQICSSHSSGLTDKRKKEKLRSQKVTKY
jgi:hypothetical protein